MRFFVTSDSFWEARVDKVVEAIDAIGYKQFFTNKNYGNDLNSITVILMCQDPSLNLKQRIKYIKKEKKIYIDIMLDLNQFLQVSQKEKENIVINKIMLEVPRIIAKYKLKEFEFYKFETDLKKCMNKLLSDNISHYPKQ